MASNTEIQIYYENETVSTPLWVSSGRLQYLKASFADIPCDSLSLFFHLYIFFKIIFVIFLCVFKKISLWSECSSRSNQIWD